VRGNLLSIDQQWEDADSANSLYQAVPAHLSLVWQNELPYWQDLTEAELNELKLYHAEVRNLLEGQNLSFEWLTVPVLTAPNLYPAFVPLKIHSNRPLKKRLRHFQKDHAAICDFLGTALNQENIQTWRIQTEALAGDLAVAAAAWFNPEDARHVAIALSKVDNHVFK
jgi:hypothetical protein